MRALFNGYYSPTEQEFEEMWGNCTFVFDANTLLNLYRYPQVSRDLLLRIIEHIQDRIWIPYQVAMEYHKHLIELIHTQENDYEKVASTIERSLSALSKDLIELRHSNIKVDKILELTDRLVQESKSELEKQKLHQPNLEDLKDKLQKLIGNKIGREYEQEELRKIYAEGEIRYSRKIPPGFKDLKDKKDKKTYHNNIEYLDLYGDLVYWFQLLEKSKEPEVNSVILITDDTKEDWILEISKKKKGPLPELIQEFKRSSENKPFYMYNTEQFLKHSKRYFKLDDMNELINEDITQAVKQIEEAKIEVNIRDVRNQLIRMLRTDGLTSKFNYKAIIAKKNPMFPEIKIISFFSRDVYYIANTEIEIDKFTEKEGIIVLYFSSEIQLNPIEILDHYATNRDGNFIIIDVGILQ